MKSPSSDIIDFIDFISKLPKQLDNSTFFMNEKSADYIQKLALGIIPLQRPAKGWRRHVRKMKAAKRKHG